MPSFCTYRANQGKPQRGGIGLALNSSAGCDLPVNYPQSGFTLKDIRPVGCLETKTHVSFFVTSEIIIVVLGWAESGFLIKKKKKF